MLDTIFYVEQISTYNQPIKSLLKQFQPGQSKKHCFSKFKIKQGVAKTRGSRWIERTVPNCVLRLPSRNVRSKENYYSVKRDLLQCQK